MDTVELNAIRSSSEVRWSLMGAASNDGRELRPAKVRSVATLLAAALALSACCTSTASPANSVTHRIESAASVLTGVVRDYESVEPGTTLSSATWHHRFLPARRYLPFNAYFRWKTASWGHLTSVEVAYRIAVGNWVGDQTAKFRILYICQGQGPVTPASTHCFDVLVARQRRRWALHDAAVREAYGALGTPLPDLVPSVDPTGDE